MRQAATSLQQDKRRDESAQLSSAQRAQYISGESNREKQLTAWLTTEQRQVMASPQLALLLPHLWCLESLPIG